MALKEPNMNNPWRSQGELATLPFAALKELNILVMENTFHQALYHIQEEVFYTHPQMIFFYDAPADSLCIQLTDLYPYKNR
jgi:hypothetical protein